MLTLFSKEKLNIYVAAYYRGAGKRDHWALHIGGASADPDTAPDMHVFQVIHGRPFFTYQHNPTSDLLRSERAKKWVVIGTVAAWRKGTLNSMLGEIDRLLGDIRVINDDENWCCQDWTRSAVEVLEKEGYVGVGTVPRIGDLLGKVGPLETGDAGS